MGRASALLTLACCILISGIAVAETFVIGPGDPNLVKFTSKAPMETFDGKTKKVSGSITANPNQLTDSVDVLITVDLASLDTGISLRNKHMREEHLETDKHPTAVFHGRKVLQPSQPALALGQKVSFICQGTFDLHGVSQPVEWPCEVTMSTEGGKTSLHVVSHFDVKLPDYKISRPQFLVMRLDETQHLTVDLVAVQQP